MNNEKQVEKWSKMLFLTGIFLVSFVFFNILITSVFLLVHAATLAVVPILSVAISCLMIVFLSRERDQIEGKYVGTVVLVSVLLIVISIVVSMLVCDRTCDGNYYHKVAIGSLAYGWNPLYEDLMTFWQNSEFPMPITSNECLWIDHYAKASYFYAAPIYKLTGNIEAGKSINIISLLAMFLLWCGYLFHRKKHTLFVFLFGAVLASCPIFGAQLLSNYIDLLVGIYLFIIILVFFVFEEPTFFGRGTLTHALLFMSLGIMINIKFSSFGYAGLFCLGYYLWYVYRVWKKNLELKELIKLTVNAAAAVFVGVLVIGLSVYGKNLLEHGHPFYPLFGEGKVDIIESNQPLCFAGMPAIEKFFYAMFSHADNIYASIDRTPKLKIPFTFTMSEFMQLHVVDLRISGFGIFFSGILIISAVVYLSLAKELFHKNRKMCIITGIPLFITMIMIPCLSESWWARYFPQIYLLPLFAILSLEENPAKWKNIISGLLVVLLLLNNGLIWGASTLAALIKSAEVSRDMRVIERTVEESDGMLVLKAGSLRGALYNVLDRVGAESVYVVQSESDPYARVAEESAYFEYVYWGIVNE